MGTILAELPLGEYTRACYLIDLSRVSVLLSLCRHPRDTEIAVAIPSQTAAITVNHYASTVEALFMAEMARTDIHSLPIEITTVTGKAGAWLAKGKQALQMLEKKKSEGFHIPPTACVKLTNMSAAKCCLEDLGIAMEADETVRIVREHHLKTTGSAEVLGKTGQQVFIVTLARGENLLGKNSGQGADTFVTVTDPSAENRLFKSHTVLGQADPTWEAAFELTIGKPKLLEVSCFDRTLMGKHDMIGSTSLKVDPLMFSEHPSQEFALTLSPRGRVYVRVDLKGGEKHEIQFYMDQAVRHLDRSAEAMTRCIVDRVGTFF